MNCAVLMWIMPSEGERANVVTNSAEAIRLTQKAEMYLQDQHAWAPDQIPMAFHPVKGGTRRKLSGDLSRYPPDINVEAPISILAVVAPDGSIKSVQPRQKGNTQLENAAMKEPRHLKFESLSSSASQLDQSCVVTFLFKLKLQVTF